MTPQTRTTVLATLRKRHDQLLADLYRERFGDLAKGRFDGRRTELARELRALRNALRELEPTDCSSSRVGFSRSGYSSPRANGTPSHRWHGGLAWMASKPDTNGPSGLPWVIENVPGAPLDGFVLCGATFGLPVVRHRRFETSPPILLAPSSCHQSSWDRGTEHPGTYPFAHGAWRPAWRQHVMPLVWPWMTLEEAGEAIPPAYTEWIGRQLMAVITARQAVPA